MLSVDAPLRLPPPSAALAAPTPLPLARLGQGRSLLPPAPPPTPEERLAAELAPLASQHHHSAYSRSKFGPRGSPLTYFPLSLAWPDHWAALRARQAAACPPGAPLWFAAPPPPPARTLGPGAAPAPAQDADGALQALVDELHEAMAAALPEHAAPADGVGAVKTSATHPINVSALVPPAFLPVLTPLLAYAAPGTPTVFDVPAHLTLDRLAAFPPTLSGPFAAPLFNPALHLPAAPARRTAPAPPPPPPGSTRPSTPLPAAGDARAGSPSPAPSLASSYAALSLADAAGASTTSLSMSGASRLAPPSADDIRTPAPATPVEGGSPAVPGTPVEVEARASADGVGAGTPQVLGNMLMSSCPGKKVRLTGPQNGRGAVRRDVRADLARIRALGAAAVLCCLDDEELAFLGAPWDEYAAAAAALGLDVLRLPTPEGLAPLTPAALDAQLQRVLAQYTLRGRHVLVHCRGGVGRAGVVACCWALKLGLCGWLETDPRADASAAPAQAPTQGLAPRPPTPPAGAVRRDTRRLVERAVLAVRRRRSVKAIETYEQVRFLVAFVEHLRASGAAGGAWHDARTPEGPVVDVVPPPPQPPLSAPGFEWTSSEPGLEDVEALAAALAVEVEA